MPFKYKVFKYTKGIHWVPNRSKWSARVSRRGVRFFLGYFTLYKEACDAVTAFKDRHKSYQNPGHGSSDGTIDFDV